MDPVLQAIGIQKSYGSVCAIENIDFEIYPGEVVALLGDNGAGKSTFIKILSGVVRQSRGQLLMDGRSVQFASPMEARAYGVETVYQDLALAPDLDITANIFLGREILRGGILGRLGFLSKREMQSQIGGKLGQLKVNIQSVSQPVSDLSGGQRQAVSILRAASWGQKLVIMDEPTAALGVEESAKVLDLIKQVKARGIPVILVTHTLPYAFDVADRIVILRLGKSVAQLKAKETDVNEVVQWITGSKTVSRISELQGHR